ncbi:uncharacterized protein LOC144207694 isoform X2 [Stigmatopora nigra]
MTAKEIEGQISQLDKHQSHLHLQNTDMMNLVDAANDKMTVLPSEKEENESNLIKEENEKLLAKVRRLQVQREQDKRSLSEFSIALKNIEVEAFQQKEEFIQQNNLQLKQAEETVEEYSNIIKDLRLANQELRSQLEDREGEALLATSIDSVGENEASHIPEMTFAEEIMLLVSPVEIKSTTEYMSIKEDTKAEELSSPPSNQPTNRCTVTNKFSRWKMYVVYMAIISILVILATVAHVRNLDFLSFYKLWRSVCGMLQPYFSVHYGALPPI